MGSPLVGAIGRVRERFEPGGPWQEWADAVLSGAVTVSCEAIEAAEAAEELTRKGPEPQRRIALAAHAVAHATAIAVVHDKHAARVVKWAHGTVERELRDA